MKGGHDLGGQLEMGPINPEPESQEPVFHADWERRVFALTLATGMLGKWNIDESRRARERQDPLVYVRNSYYENWLEGLETLLLEKGLVDAEELVLATNISSQTKKLCHQVVQRCAIVRPLHSLRWGTGLLCAGLATTALSPVATVDCLAMRAVPRDRFLIITGRIFFPTATHMVWAEAPEPLYSVVFLRSALWSGAEHRPKC